MLTAEQQARILPFWAGLISLIAIYYLTENAWKAVIISTMRL
jgi:hypothetical protein